jgi:adenosylhomocysteine nucleosidase
MRIAIIAAMEAEVQYLRKHINNHEAYDFQGYTYHIGDMKGQKIVLVQSGIGKVNAALSTTLLLEHFSVSEIINTGSAGGVGSSLQIGDVIVADEAVYNDVDVRAFGYSYGQVPKMPQSFPMDETIVNEFTKAMEKFKFSYAVGLIASGDQFVTDMAQLQDVLQTYSTLQAVDMEATAIAQVCYQYMIPLVIVRSISDLVFNKEKSSNEEFEQYLDIAAQHSTAVILEFLQTKTERQDEVDE